MENLLVISGLSGAGKSTALGFFEDMGYFCMDNVPPVMMESLFSLLTNSSVKKAAMVVDVRSGAFGDLVDVMRKLKSEYDGLVKVIFLEAEISEIVRRYALTRRRHPLQVDGMSVERAVLKEKEMLSGMRDLADYKIDTTHLNTHTLRERLKKLLEALEETRGRFVFRLSSFGYKYGLPVDADFVFDTRFFPNPHYVPGLSEKTGLDPEVRDFFSAYPEIEDYVKDVVDILERAKVGYEREGRDTLSIAVGCTGGRHRSVYVVEKLAEVLRDMGESVVVEHRDVGKG